MVVGTLVGCARPTKQTSEPTATPDPQETPDPQVVEPTATPVEPAAEPVVAGPGAPAIEPPAEPPAESLDPVVVTAAFLKEEAAKGTYGVADCDRFLAKCLQCNPFAKFPASTKLIFGKWRTLQAEGNTRDLETLCSRSMMLYECDEKK
jgi:hypothetical protein